MSQIRFVVTVDVEDFFLPRPPFDTYCAAIDGKAYGTPLIMDMLEEIGGKGTFFVDVYNRTTVDENLIAACMKEIDARGHEVALHTHPAFPEGKRGYGMAQTMRRLSYDAQAQSIEEGIATIARAITKKPVSHRAGGYGANRDTLRALKANGITIDSSLLYDYPYCDLNTPPLGINVPVIEEGVLEVPVSVTRCEMHAMGIPLAALTKKLDPDWCSPGEILRQAAALKASGVATIILFLHSYSFIDIERGFVPNQKSIASFRELLRRLEGEFITLAEAATHIHAPTAPMNETLPIVRSNLLTEWELTCWLLGKVRPRHFAALWKVKHS
jgi:hypothetical protein